MGLEQSENNQDFWFNNVIYTLILTKFSTFHWIGLHFLTCKF